MGIKVEVKHSRRSFSSDDERQKADEKSLEFALKKLKKLSDREGTLKDYRRHEYYEKPSDRRRREKKMRNKINAMKAQREREQADNVPGIGNPESQL